MKAKTSRCAPRACFLICWSSGTVVDVMILVFIGIHIRCPGYPFLSVSPMIRTSTVVVSHMRILTIANASRRERVGICAERRGERINSDEERLCWYAAVNLLVSCAFVIPSSIKASLASCSVCRGAITVWTGHLLYH